MSTPDRPAFRLVDQLAAEELAALERGGLRRQLQPLSGAPGTHIEVAGQRLLSFSSNDYLGLATHPRLAAAAARAASEATGATAARAVVGSLPCHDALEQALAAFEGSEAALLFGSGYQANVGVLQALCGPEDVVLSDAWNHASLIDGARLSRARVEVYGHLDLADLERRLEATAPARRRVVVTDSVFSMDGDLADLPALVALCRRHAALLVVDEAHATGLYGAQATGLCEAQGVAHEVDVRVGTLSKALGSYGAFVASGRATRELLLNRARSFIFTTALPPTVCAASLEALSVLRDEPWRRERLWAHVETLAAGLNALGLPAAPRSPIFPVQLGSPERALAAAAGLAARGIWVRAIRPPTVPIGTSRLRLTLSAAHTDQEVRALLQALAELLPTLPADRADPRGSE